MTHFRELMEIMQKALLEGDPEKADPEKWILPKGNRSTTEQLEVYTNAYLWRLVDVVAEDYEALEYLLKDEEDDLHDLLERYVRANPSRFRSLSRYGQDLWKYMEKDEKFSSSPHFDLARGIARLESSIARVYDLPEDPPLHQEDLQSLDPTRFGELTFTLRRAVELHSFDYPVNEFVTAVYREEDPSLPESKESYLAVFRHEYKIWRMELDREEYLLLKKLDSGQTVMEALQALVEETKVDPAELMAPIQGWFARWVGEGLLAGNEE